MINKIRQLDGVDMLPNYKWRINLSHYYVDSVTKIEDPVRQPVQVALDPANPSHQPAIMALKSAWDEVTRAVGADR